jgi:hypothetical protein
MQDDSAPPEDRAFWDDINKGKVPAEFGGGANDQYFSLIDKSKQAYEAPPAASRAFAGMRADLCAAVYSRVGARVARTSLARACAHQEIFLRVYGQAPGTRWEGRSSLRLPLPLARCRRPRRLSQ